MTRCLFVLMLAALVFAPPAAAGPYDCRNTAYAHQHPNECQESGAPYLLGGGQPTGDPGQPGDGGLLGAINRVLGGIGIHL